MKRTQADERPPVVLALGVALAVMLLVTLADYFSGPMLNVAIFKSVALVVSAAARSKKWLWACCLFLVTMSFAMLLTDRSEELGPDVQLALLINRSFVAMSLVLLAIVLHWWIDLDARLRQARADLERQNAELAQREDKIQRQNVELQSTAGELERQSERLRVANEELAQRERKLETMLELSRSLHVGLNYSQTLSRICETLARLVNGPNVATAILLADGNGFRTECHYGFGSGGVRQKTISRPRAFAGLVLEQGRAAYLEDLSLHPDREIPQPSMGEPMVSVLSAPLRVRGVLVGTIELYSRERRRWSEVQIALIESLAAQTSISIENARLFEEIGRGRRRLATILEHVPVGLSIASADLLEVRLNAAGAAMLGEPPDTNIALQFSGPPWQVFENGKLLPRDRFPIVRAARGERVYPHEVELVLPTGRRLSLLSSAAPFHDADGKIVGAVSTFVDITQLKQLQRELEARRREAEEASGRKSRFLAAASHDIRTPANAISLLAELLKRSADNPSMAGDIPELAEELRVSATSLVNLVSNILDVTRFDTDKLQLHESEFPLAQLLEEEIRQVQPLAQAKKLIIDSDSPPAGLWLRTDRIKLGRVLGNLLGNAIKFTDNGGVHLQSSSDGKGLKIFIRDTGIGISPENQAHIFNEFWQLSDPARSKGSGLGLAICKRLVEAMGGNIEVASTVEKGSTFTITLPASCCVQRRDSA